MLLFAVEHLSNPGKVAGSVFSVVHGGSKERFWEKHFVIFMIGRCFHFVPVLNTTTLSAEIQMSRVWLFELGVCHLECVVGMELETLDAESIHKVYQNGVEGHM